jgi:hypothetical protein
MEYDDFNLVFEKALSDRDFFDDFRTSLISEVLVNEYPDDYPKTRELRGQLSNELIKLNTINEILEYFKAHDLDYPKDEKMRDFKKQIFENYFKS